MNGDADSDANSGLWSTVPLPPGAVRIVKGTLRLATNTFATVLTLVTILVCGTPMPWVLAHWSGVWKQGVWRSKYGWGGGQKSPEIGPRDRLGPRPSLNRNNFEFFWRKFALFQRLGLARDSAAGSRNLPVEAIPDRSHTEAEAKSI